VKRFGARKFTRTLCGRTNRVERSDHFLVLAHPRNDLAPTEDMHPKQTIGGVVFRDLPRQRLELCVTWRGSGDNKFRERWLKRLGALDLYPHVLFGQHPLQKGVAMFALDAVKPRFAVRGAKNVNALLRLTRPSVHLNVRIAPDALPKCVTQALEFLPIRRRRPSKIS